MQKCLYTSPTAKTNKTNKQKKHLQMIALTLKSQASHTMASKLYTNSFSTPGLYSNILLQSLSGCDKTRKKHIRLEMNAGMWNILFMMCKIPELHIHELGAYSLLFPLYQVVSFLITTNRDNKAICYFTNKSTNTVPS